FVVARAMQLESMARPAVEPPQAMLSGARGKIFPNSTHAQPTVNRLRRIRGMPRGRKPQAGVLPKPVMAQAAFLLEAEIC
ncbi:MAG: hypothetical protein O7A69_01040, partial [SAR324 cluster bacterium]|nr:hypothetical protein [SAR324 cluster bacterium]